MKILLVAFVALFTATSLPTKDAEWSEFKIQYRKNYENSYDEQYRMKIFMANKNKIAQHNHKYDSGDVSYKMKLNKYSDMLNYEFISTLNGFNKTSGKSRQSAKIPVGTNFVEPANIEFPESVDWRLDGAVTAVKDQGHCAACWAFSATGSLEGQHFRRNGVLVSLSEQNLIDCSGEYGNNGCKGGYMNQAFEYIHANNGLDTEETYPYDGPAEECRYDPRNAGAMDYGFVNIPEGSETNLLAAVATVGPVSVAIDSSHPSFHFYSEGVYDEPDCSTTELDHSVLVVGYGTDENGVDYWLVKNSWGDTWGENGYIKMSRNKDNQCGIASCASYPLV